MGGSGLRRYEIAAEKLMAGPVWDYFAGGSGTEATLRGARTALNRFQLRPRCLVDVDHRDPRTLLLGDELAVPLGIAPMAYHRLAHPEGEVATARAAGEAGVVFTVGMFASRTLEDVAEAASGPLWLQLYWLKRRDEMTRLIRRAEDAGYRALVLTVDTPLMAHRPRDAHHAFTLPAGVRAENVDPSIMAASHGRNPGESSLSRHSREQFDAAVTWEDLSWLREQSSLPLLLKGILGAEDAELAVEHGVDGIIVSNHGGRQLDFAIPAVECLGEITRAVKGRCQVVLDGDIRHGTDVAKALCLGADAVFIGRPIMWGLAHSGSEGVLGVLRLLAEEFDETMALMGVPSVKDFTEKRILRPSF